MIARLAPRVVAGLLLATGLAAVPVATSTAGGPTVSAANMQFSPSRVTAALGASVTWTFPDAVAHTTTSTQGFWNSGSRSGGQTFAHTFGGAGSYPYKCTFHPSMTGSVQVPVARSGSASSGWTLRWATAAGGDTTTYDVQVRKGTRRWKALRTDTTAASTRFARPGTWSVRARTTQGSATSGWSPAVVVKTS